MADDKLGLYCTKLLNLYSFVNTVLRGVVGEPWERHGRFLVFIGKRQSQSQRLDPLSCVTTDSATPWVALTLC